MITVDDLLDFDGFKDLPSEKLSALIPHLKDINFPSNKTIIYRGDPGYSMFMVVDGEVAVTLTNDEGVEYSIAKLAKGDIFGEMALLTGEPRSANVKALSAVRLLELSQKAFFELVAAFPNLKESFLRLLVQRKAKMALYQQPPSPQQKGDIASLFAEPQPVVDRLLGKTKWTIETNAAIDRLSVDTCNVFILGEHGTGKDLAARLIHFGGMEVIHPLFHLDCANPPPIQRLSNTGKAGSKDALHWEIAQESALFGHGIGAGSFALSVRRGYLELADGGVVILENIDALSPRIQGLLVNYLENGYFERTGDAKKISCKVRLLATSSRQLSELSESANFDPSLLKGVGKEILILKPLRERKKDIPVIADYFLQESNQKFSKKISGFSKEALNLLVDHDWPLNVDELRQVVERAVVIATGNIVEEGQVFLNIPSFSATGKYNLLRIPSVRKIVNHQMFPTGLRFITIPFILALIIFTLIGPPANNPANFIVWAIWWPFLIISIVIAARNWCSYCPLPAISDALNFHRKKFFSIPGWLAKYGFWIGMIGFAFIILSEHAAHMFTVAHATSILLLTILGGATVTNFFFGKRSWCRHLCPLGKMVSHTSALSFIELGSNSTVCSSQCQTHDCVKENSCPMGLHPSAAAVSKDCILCFSCVKRCKHQALRINVRFPWNEILIKEKWDIAGAFFAIFLTSLVLAVKLPSWAPFSRFLSQQFAENYQLADIAVTVCIGITFTALSFLFSGFPGSTSWRHYFAISGHAYLFLAFAGFFNIYFHEFAYRGQNLIPWIIEQGNMSDLAPAEWFTPDLGTLKGLIPTVTLVGATCSLVLLTKLSKKHSIPKFVCRAHKSLLLVTTVCFLVVL